MKWIKKRNLFLEEAKIRDVVLPRQAKEIKDTWGSKYLDYEEAEPTDKIDQGVWKLSDEDKKKVLGAFFDIDMDELYDIFKSLPKKLIEIVKESIDGDKLDPKKKEKFGKVLANFDLSNPSLDEIYLLYENIFRKLSVSETKSGEIIQRDETGRPIMGEDNRPIKVKKEKGEPVFSNNLVNFNSFITDYNRCYPNDKVNEDHIYEFQNGIVQSVKNFAAEDFSGGDYEIDFGLFQGDLYLSILHNPKDILNMSISKFYSSCQHLYTGMYRSQVLGNVFDPNSIPAYLKFDTPIYWKDEKISDQVPISRVMIRNIETFDDNDKEKKIFFDRVYPDSRKVPSVMKEMIEKYSNNKQTVDSSETYIFSPDVDTKDLSELGKPYMDRLALTTGRYIGANTKSLYLSSSYDWSKTIISPKANVKEIVIETTNLPKNVLDIKLSPDWIKFKFIDIKTLKDFDIETDSYAFDKCKLDQSVLEDIKLKGNLKNLQFISCELSQIDLSIFDTLEELHLVYSIEDEDLNDIIGDINLKKLVISGDLMSNTDNKNYVSDLKRKGIKVEVVGLKL